MGKTLVPQMGRQASVFGSLYYQLILVLFLTMDGHLLFINYFVRSYILIPIAEVPSFELSWSMFELIIRMTSDLFVVALTMGAPVLIAIFVTDICMGLFNKVAPQINILFIMMPFKAVLGILFSMLALTLFVQQSEYLMARALRQLWIVIRTLVPL